MAHPEAEIYHDLALRLGYASPRQMLRDMTSAEVTDWLEYFTLKSIRHQQEGSPLGG